MIDFIKINRLPVTSDAVLANEHLTFTHSNVTTEGEIINRAQVAHFEEMDVIVKGKSVRLKGSLHKLFEGGTNHRDFSINNIRSVIDELVKTFRFDPTKALINFIEVGVNIPFSTDPNPIIKSFLRYKHETFKTMKVIGNGYYRCCDLQQFSIKVYNKSLQNNLDSFLLRIEIKINRMHFLKSWGISDLTLEDLKKRELYEKLLKMLLDVFNQVLLNNPSFNINSITNHKDRELILQGLIPEYWDNLPRTTRMRKISRFSELVGSNSLKAEISKLITAKWNELTTLKNQAVTQQNKKAEQINTTIKGYSRKCSVTHVDISMQKGNSRFLSTAGLRWLKENDAQKYLDLRNRYLPRTGIAGLHTRYEQDEITHIAKQIRNEYYNRRRYFDRVPENQLSFFE